MSKGNGEALKNDEAMLKCDNETLKGDGKV